MDRGGSGLRRRTSTSSNRGRSRRLDGSRSRRLEALTFYSANKTGKSKKKKKKITAYTAKEQIRGHTHTRPDRRTATAGSGYMGVRKTEEEEEQEEKCSSVEARTTLNKCSGAESKTHNWKQIDFWSNEGQRSNDNGPFFFHTATSTPSCDTVPNVQIFSTAKLHGRVSK